MLCRSLFVLLYFFLLIIVLFVLLRYTDFGCPFYIFKTLLIEYIKKKLIKWSKFTKRIFCQFSQYYWGTLHNWFFFPIKTILVVYDIYFINQLLKNDNNKNKQIKNKQAKNKAKKKLKMKIKKQPDKQPFN